MMLVATTKPADLLHLLGSTPPTLNALLAGVSSEQMTWKPAAERWSIAEVLVHLIDVEMRNLRVRARRIVEEDAPHLTSYDQMAEYAKGTYSGKDGRAALERFGTIRQGSLSWLETLSQDDWVRTGVHFEVGLLSLENVVHLWAFHDLGHIRQITELVRAATLWEGLGPMQRYYSINP